MYSDRIIYFAPVLLIIVAWSMIWKGIALWKAGKNNQMVWFILLFVLNTLGILPIVYILFFQKDQSSK